MKKSIYKYISIILSAVILTLTLFNCVSVKSYCAIDIIQDFSQEAGEISSAFLGFVWDSAVDVGHNFLQFLGLETEEEQAEYLNNHYIIDDPAPGQAGHVKIDDTLKDDMQDFIDDYKQNNPDFSYGYSSNVDLQAVGLYQKSFYDEIKRVINQNPNYIFIPYHFRELRYGYSSMYEEISTSSCFRLIGVPYPTSFVYSSIVTNPNTSPQAKYFQGSFFDSQWEDALSSSDCKVYTFKNSSSTQLTLSTLGVPQINNRVNLFTDSYYSNTVNINAFDIYIPLTSGSIIQFPVFNSVETMQRYTVGNLPYYNVPTNPNVVYNGGYYSLTDSQLGDSISYGDISSYVETNSVTNYETVINYINNYYSSGSGGGSGGDSGGGSGGDIDWSWLGRIGEVIGGLIAALGNVVAGVIDAIASLIESLTVNLPNTLGQLIAWLMPFLPEEITALLGAFFMVVVIIGVIKLLRR